MRHDLIIRPVQQSSSSELDADPLSGRDIVEQLRSDIVNGDFQPNTRLKFAELKKRYDAGIGTLREALTHLVSEGFVTLKANKGFAVAPVSREELLEITEHYIEFERRAISSSITNGNDEWEAQIVSAHHRLNAIEKKTWEQRVKRHSEWVIRHREFHETLVAACDGEWLFRLRSLMFDQLERYRFLTKMAPKGMGGRKRIEHKKIMEAVLERDIKNATLLMDSHVRDTSKKAVKLLENFQRQKS